MPQRREREKNYFAVQLPISERPLTPSLASPPSIERKGYRERMGCMACRVCAFLQHNCRYSPFFLLSLLLPPPPPFCAGPLGHNRQLLILSLSRLALCASVIPLGVRPLLRTHATCTKTDYHRHTYELPFPYPVSVGRCLLYTSPSPRDA